MLRVLAGIKKGKRAEDLAESIHKRRYEKPSKIDTTMSATNKGDTKTGYDIACRCSTTPRPCWYIKDVPAWILVKRRTRGLGCIQAAKMFFFSVFEQPVC